MDPEKLDQLILQMENYVECCKQFNHYVNLARIKKFDEEDENQFLEIKSVITQELELILAAVELTSPTRDEIHNLISEAPSLRYLSELNETTIRGLENQWHKIYIAWQSNLGQMKVHQRELDEKPKWSFRSIFGGKKK